MATKVKSPSPRNASREGKGRNERGPASTRASTARVAKGASKRRAPKGQGPGDLTSVESRMRSLPQQERARQAVDRILEATGQLIDESGFESLTTTAIAERAGVNIATLYRYFPDKFKVVHEFAMRREAERWDTMRPLLEDLATASDWRRALDQLIARTVKMRLAQSGGRTLRRALQSSPELWQVDRELDVRATAVLAEAVRRRKPRIQQPQAHRVAETVITAGVVLLDNALVEHDDPRKAVAEALRMLKNYLADYLD
jgi:AcrR family transcriptional regulator